VGGGISTGSNRHIVWNAGADWNGQFSSQVKFKVIATDSAAPAGMVLIPAGNYQMGNSTNSEEGGTEELPVHTVYVSGFYMDRYEVTKQLWDDVRLWNGGNGYELSAGSGKEASHPVHRVSWYDAVKWCNARSQRDGLVPVYYTDDAQTMIYKTGSVNVTNAQVKWNANGYRLPTEAEWEKAARGGLNAQRFPWGATITHSQANYNSSAGYSYDVSPTRNYHPTYAVGGFPYTSPVGSFAPNGYGLYEMAGNVWEWCWDWLGDYSSSFSSDPQGPSSGSARVRRGGSWFGYALDARVVRRTAVTPGTTTHVVMGFRSVRR
jgi:formylglycine-generating enzyme required for sulfatase activity